MYLGLVSYKEYILRSESLALVPSSAEHNIIILEGHMQGTLMILTIIPHAALLALLGTLH